MNAKSIRLSADEELIWPMEEELASSSLSERKPETAVWEIPQSADIPDGGTVLYEMVKRLFDIFFSMFALVLLSPLFLTIAVLIKLEDGGPVFYRHRRVGRYGKEIEILKFRSMKVNADALESILSPEQLQEYYTEFKISHDPRVTRVGRKLRRMSLDELPQLVNILGGTLSFCGPRPTVWKETYLYGNHRNMFLSIKPGLTGYWQAYARNNVGYSDGKRQKMELHYIKHRSLWFDVRILFKTVSRVVRRDGAM